MANFGGPTLLKRTLGLQEDRYSQYIGPTTDFEPSLINLSNFDTHDESLLARGTLRRVSDEDTFLLLPDSATPGYHRILEDADEIERIVAPNGRKLIDLYFKIVHPAFPILQKNVFYEKYERSYREFSPPLLAAIYLLAINWWDHCEELAGQPKPNVRELERLVRTSLADAMYRPKLSTIQAGLILSQRPEGDQWAPTGQLVAIGQELGLHLDCTHWKIPPWERGLRKRLAWALYMQVSLGSCCVLHMFFFFFLVLTCQDKWGALVHGRPSHIFASNWAVQQLTPNDFPEVEWDENNMEERMEIERGRAVFGQMVQLSQILAEILETFYTLQASQAVAAAGPQGTQLVLSLAKPIQLKLKEWYSGLPAIVRMEPSIHQSMQQPGKFSPIGYLHLAYFATEITLHRRIIRSMESSAQAARAAAQSGASNATTNGAGTKTSQYSASPAGSNLGSPYPPCGIDPYVQHICRSAAKARLISAMDFVNRLTPAHLRAFWYFASKTNFALIGTFGSLLWATSPGREEADWYRRRLGEYRWTLSVSSKPGEGKGLTEFAMGMLDISTGLLKQLPEKPSLSRSNSAVDLDMVRRQSMLALGATSPAAALPGRSSSMASMSGLSTLGGSAGSRFQQSSAEGSGVQSPRSPESDESDDDDGVYGNFSATAGMAGIGD